MEEVPTGRSLFLYYFFGVVPSGHRAWVERDVHTRAWLVRHSLQRVAFFAAFILILRLFSGGGISLLPFIPVAAIVVALDLTVFARWQRRQALRNYARKWDREPGTGAFEVWDSNTPS